MKNKHIPGRDHNRVPLHTVVPRSVPFAISYAPSDVCNFKCIYCNHSTPEGISDAKIVTYDEFMTFASQVEDLVMRGGVPLKIIRLGGNGEPLLNKLLPIFVNKLKNFSDRIELTTNASLLTHDISEQLIDAGLTRILISVQGVTIDKYKKICTYPMDMSKFIEQLSYFKTIRDKRKSKCSIYIKSVNIAFSDEKEKSTFFKIFTPLCDEINIENIMRSFANVNYDSFCDSNIDKITRYGNTFIEKIVCEQLFMSMNIHSNGDVDCCSCEYPPLYIGNIFKKPLVDLWNGSFHKSLMIKHLQGRRFDIPKCAHCTFSHFSAFEEDNLDNFRDDVLSKVLNL